jgi:recombination protein RecT
MFMTTKPDTKDLKAKLAAKAQATLEKNQHRPDKPQDPALTIHSYLKQMLPEIQRALPRHLDADRLARLSLTTIRTNPKLLECSLPSLLGAVMQAAQLGLEPGLLGHCYLVPFYNKHSNKSEVQFIIGYKGLLDLVRRTGEITAIAAHEVREEDHFSFHYGLEEELVHRPRIDGDRGAVYAYYSYARFKDGGHAFLVMSRQEVEKYRDRFSKSKTGPWTTDFDAMAKKTVLRQLVKYLPLSVEVQQKLVADETVVTKIGDEPRYIDPAIFDNQEPAEEPDREGENEHKGPNEVREPAAIGVENLEPRNDNP